MAPAQLRRPPGLQDRELAVGRGFVVKSGQPTMMQVAAPYALYSTAEAPDLDDDAAAAQIAQALDSWVKLIRNKTSGQQAVWANGATAATRPATGTAVNGNLRKALDLLRQLANQSASNGTAPVDDVALLAAYVRAEFERTGKSDILILSTTPEDSLTAASDYLSTLETNGHNGTA